MLLSYAFYGSSAVSVCADSYVIYSGFGYRFLVLLAGGSPAATHFLLLRQKKVSKEKATLVSASLRFATGNLRCSLQAGSAQTRLTPQTVRGPDPPEAVLLGADTRGEVGQPDTKIPKSIRTRRSASLFVLGTGFCLWFAIPIVPFWPGL